MEQATCLREQGQLDLDQGQFADTHPRHFLSVSELFEPLASSQVHVKFFFRPHADKNLSVDVGRNKLISVPSTMGKWRELAGLFMQRRTLLARRCGPK